MWGTIHTRLLLRCTVVVGKCILLLLLATPWCRGDEPSSSFQAYLSAGEFGPARAVADQLPNAAARDGALRQLAEAQASAGAWKASYRTAFEIDQDALRSSTFGQLAASSQGSMGQNSEGALGGAALADFDTLIDLITSTVAPESWDTVGGPGAVESFPTGVYVNPDGVLKRIASGGALEDLLAARRSAEHAPGERDLAARDHGNRELGRPTALRKVSLTRLERHIEMLWAAGREPTEAMRHLAGLQRIEYLFFYPDTRDIVIAGPAEGWQRDFQGRWVGVESKAPTLRLDDLVVVLRNARANEGRFGCAITPRQENLAAVQSFLDEGSSASTRSSRTAWREALREHLGLQDIHVFGLDVRTRAAQILVQADYHMKLIGMGLEDGTVGVDSYLDQVHLDAHGNPPPMDVLRWWFTLDYDALYSSPDRDAFRFAGTGVKVLSENERLAARGERIHTGRSSEQNQRFAQSFTKAFELLATKYPVYAELRHVFDMALVASLIQREDVARQIDWQMTHFGPDGAYRVEHRSAPQSVASVMNHRLLDRHMIVGVSGGVQVDVPAFLSAAQEQRDAYQRLDPAHADSDPSAIPLEQWWWD